MPEQTRLVRLAQEAEEDRQETARLAAQPRQVAVEPRRSRRATDAQRPAGALHERRQCEQCRSGQVAAEGAPSGRAEARMALAVASEQEGAERGAGRRLGVGAARPAAREAGRRRSIGLPHPAAEARRKRDQVAEPRPPAAVDVDGRRVVGRPLARRLRGGRRRPEEALHRLVHAIRLGRGPQQEQQPKSENTPKGGATTHFYGVTRRDRADA